MGSARNIGFKSVTKAKKPKQANSDLLIKNYILNGCKNGKQAAIDAGYSEKTAEQSASRVLRSVKAQAEIEKHKKAELEVYVWSKTDKLKRLELIAENSMQKDGDQKMINASAAIAAIRTHNEMQGDNAPIETNATVTSNIMPVPVADSVESWADAASKNQEALLKHE